LVVRAKPQKRPQSAAGAHGAKGRGRRNKAQAAREVHAQRKTSVFAAKPRSPTGAFEAAAKAAAAQNLAQVPQSSGTRKKSARVAAQPKRSASLRAAEGSFSPNIWNAAR